MGIVKPGYCRHFKKSKPQPCGCLYNGVYNTATSWLSDDLTIEKFFDFNDLKPGDWGEDTLSMLVGSNEAYACANIKVTENSDNGMVDSEDEMDSAIDGLDGTPNGDLANEINFVVWLDDGVFAR